MTSDDEVEINSTDLPEELAILPLRNTVIFPGVVAPITAGRDKSLRLIRSITEEPKYVGMIAQRDGDNEDPGAADVFPIGTLAQIVKSFKMPDGNTTIIIQGKKRFKVLEWTQTEPYNRAKVEFLPEFVPAEDDVEFNILMESIKDVAAQLIQDSPHIPTEAQAALDNIKSNTFLLNFIASNSSMTLDKKQEVLELDELKDRATKVLEGLNLELKMSSAPINSILVGIFLTVRVLLEDCITTSSNSFPPDSSLKENSFFVPTSIVVSMVLKPTYKIFTVWFPFGISVNVAIPSKSVTAPFSNSSKYTVAPNNGPSVSASLTEMEISLVCANDIIDNIKNNVFKNTFFICLFWFLRILQMYLAFTATRLQRLSVAVVAQAFHDHICLL